MMEADTVEMLRFLGLPVHDKEALKGELAKLIAPIMVEYGWEPGDERAYERAVKVAYYRALAGVTRGVTRGT